MPYEFVKK